MRKRCEQDNPGIVAKLVTANTAKNLSREPGDSFPTTPACKGRARGGRSRETRAAGGAARRPDPAPTPESRR